MHIKQVIKPVFVQTLEMTSLMDGDYVNLLIVDYGLNFLKAH
jgi:hypothetical protein